MWHPNILNFGKYFVSFISVILSYLTNFNKDYWFKFWIVFAIISTVYSYSWDIKMDWKFLQPNPRKKFLRPLLSYKSTHMYYIAILINLVLRFTWVLNMSSEI